jgi:hypothetical protein
MNKMELEKIFKNLILINFSLLIIMWVLAFYEPKEITNLQEELGFGYIDSDIGFLFFLVLTIVHFINLYLLYKFKSFGKPLYLIMVILSLISVFFSGPKVSSSLFSVLDYLDAIVVGATLIFLYFTPIKEKFEKK